MEGKENITEYRDKLDKTLKSDDLCNVEFLKKLVENQLSKSSQHEDQEYSDNLVQKRTKEVANFIGMLRSTSGSVDEVSHNGWKIKHDNQDCRVMYREGPTGTPFHSLLAEGYVDGPLDVCMCISCEASLYPKWWPQFNIPTFKVTSSEIVKKIRMGEQISLVRMKLSWPLSTREALVHYVTIDYFQDGLIIVLLNSISETEIIDIDTHGFTKDGIPDVENVTRIDIVGGVAIQKVSTNRSYFRTIANMDIKLDFVPPTIINFVSRQLIGSGFKLYKKEVASVCKGDEDFSMALKDPCYHRIREALYLENNEQNEVSKQEDIKIVHEILEQQRDEDIKELKTQNPVCEIEEIEESEKPHEDSNNNGKEVNEDSNKKIIVGRKQVIISPEVNQALGTLEKVISIFREIGFNPRSMSLSRFANNLFADLEDKKSNDSKRFVTQVNESTLKSSQESRNGFDDDEDTPSSFSFVINEPGVPVLGNLLQLKEKKPYMTFTKWAEMYGPIYSIRTGATSMVVVSSNEIAKEVVVTRFPSISTRKLSYALKVLTEDKSMVAMSDYNDYHKTVKRHILTAVLGPNAQKKFRAHRDTMMENVSNELHAFFEKNPNQEVNLRKIFQSQLFGLAMKQALGKDVESIYVKDLETTMKREEIFEVLVVDPMMGAIEVDWRDFFPYLKWVPNKSFENIIHRMYTRREAVMKALIQEHKKRIASGEKLNSYIDYLLSEAQTLTDKQLRMSLWEPIIESSDTTMVTTEWAMYELAKNPNMQDRLYEEIQSVCGSEKITEDNLSQLPYLYAVFQETLRKHCPVPIMPLRYVHENTVLGGYHVPAGTEVAINIYGCNMDKKVWENPEEWNPERFLSEKESMDLYKTMAFGGGKRVCAGSLQAMVISCIGIGRLVQDFEWKLKDDAEEDVNTLGLTTQKLHPLLALINPRK